MTWGGEEILNLHNWWHGVPKVKSSLQKSATPLRIGILGAARTNYPCILDPVSTHTSATIAAIASATSTAKAEAQIAQYGLPPPPTTTVYGSYDALLADPHIDAVYIALLNGLHATWAERALRAGKHVLIEKPIACNADEVRQIRTAASDSGKLALEAMHWRFHPAAHRVRQLCRMYGPVRSIAVRMGLPAGALQPDDIRFRYALGGGACMDLCYVFDACAYFAAANLDPNNNNNDDDDDDGGGGGIESCTFSIRSATPHVLDADPQIDESMDATFVITPPLPSRPRPGSATTTPSTNDSSAVTCRVSASLSRPLKRRVFGLVPDILDIVPPLTIECERATIDFPNFPGPWVYCRIAVAEKEAGRSYTEKLYAGGPQWGHGLGHRWWTSHRYQLEAFVQAVTCREQGTEYRGPWVPLEDSEWVAALIEDVYRTAGLKGRGR